MNYIAMCTLLTATDEPQSLIAAVALAVSHYNGHKYLLGEPALPTHLTIQKVKEVVERAVATVVKDARFNLNTSLLQIEVYLPRVTGEQCLTIIYSNSN